MLTNSASATSRLVLPAATSAATLSSVGVSSSDEGARPPIRASSARALSAHNAAPSPSKTSFRCREVSPEQPGVPEVLLDPCPQREIVARLAPSSLEHGPGPPPPFGLGEGLTQVQQHAGPSRPGHREVHRVLQHAPRQRGVPAIVVGHARLVWPAG